MSKIDRSTANFKQPAAAKPAKGKKPAKVLAEQIEAPELKVEVPTPKLTKLKFVATVVLLSALTFSTKHQAREAIDKDALADYTEVAKEAKEKGADSPFPALKAVKRGDDIFIFSGFTRGAALKKAGYEETKVEIADAPDITDAEIFRLAIEANRTQGARMTSADKRHNFEKIIKFPEYADLSNHGLAEIAGVSTFFVAQHRPAAKSGAVRKTKTGKTINTKNIGKKTGPKAKPLSKKAQKAADALAASKGGTVDQPDLGLGGENAETGAQPPANKLSEKAAKALKRICDNLDGANGITSESVREGVESGAINLTDGDLTAWSETSTDRIRRIAPLVINLSWSPKKAFSHIDAEVDGKTKVEHLINSTIACGGVLKRNSVNVGEVVADHKEYLVVVVDTRKFKVTVEPA